MNYVLFKAYRVFVFRIIICLVTASIVSGCGISSALRETNTKFENAINSFDRAITALAQESADWRVVMADLEESLAEDLQSTIRTEVHDLTRAAILTTSGEFRCNAEFLRLRLRRNLIQIRNSLARDINKQLAKIPEFQDQIPIMSEEEEEPFICSVVPSAVDLALDRERRTKIDIFGFDLRSRPISVDLLSFGNLVADTRISLDNFRSVLLKEKTEKTMEVEFIVVKDKLDRIVTKEFVLEQAALRVKKNITNALSIISDFHAVLDLTESGIELEPNAQEIVLSWNGQIQSEIAILTHQEFLECKVEEVSIDPEKVGFFIPDAVKDNKCDGKPDKDFDDNGPCVQFYIKLFLDSERKKLIAEYWMNAWECPDKFERYKNDCTEVLGSSSTVLYIAQENEKILSFNVQNYLFDEYIDKDHGHYFSYHTGASPVTVLEYIGDTDGKEAGTATGVKISFPRIKLQIERCEWK